MFEKHNRSRSSGNTYPVSDPKALAVGSNARVPFVKRGESDAEHGVDARATVPAHDGVVFGAGTRGPATGRRGGCRGRNRAHGRAGGCGDTIRIANQERLAVGAD